MTTPPVPIAIAIASAGRPSLAVTLASLFALEPLPGHAVRVIVADDSPDAAAAALVATLAPHPLPVTVLPVGAQNIAHARNALIRAALAEPAPSGPHADGLLAFVDDDEWVATDWLVRLHAGLSTFAADAVFGPVWPVYPPGTPAWFAAADPLHTDWGHHGRVVRTGRCGNTLLRLSIVRAHGLRFDPALGRSGGEDTEFFRAYGRAGGRMVVVDDARVWETAPPERLTVAYVLRRALRTGQSYARFVLRDRPGRFARVLFYADALAKAAVGLGAGLILRPFSRSAALRLARKGWLNLGKAREALGLDLPTMY